MGMKYEFNWYLVSSNSLSTFNKDDVNTITKDEIRIYPLNMPIPYIEKETGCRGMVEIIEYIVSDNRTIIKFKVIEVFETDSVIANHYFNMYKKMKGEEISNDDIEEEFNPDSIPIFKLDLLDIEESLYAKQLLHYDRINIDAGLADICSIRSINSLDMDELYVLCKYNGFSFEHSYILVFDNTGNILSIIKKPNAEYGEFIRMLKYMIEEIMNNDIHNYNVYISDSHMCNDLSDIGFKSVNLI